MRLFGHKMSILAHIGLAIVVINIALAILAPVIAPYAEAELVGDAFADPSPQYWFGLDQIGRDVFSRMLYGARMSIGLSLIFTFIILSVLGTDLPVLIATIAILDSTRVFRLSRAVAMNIVVLEFVEAAKLRGEGLWWIIRREVLPNAVPPLVAEFGLRFCFTFLFIAALSFLGLGIQPPFADWGSMVKDLAQVINYGSPAALYPAGAIALLTIGVNFI